MGIGALVVFFLMDLHDFGLESLKDLGFKRGLECLDRMLRDLALTLSINCFELIRFAVLFSIALCM